MRKIECLFYILMLSGLISCGSDMIEKGLSSMMDLRSPEINVKYGKDNIISGSMIDDDISGINPGDTSDEIRFIIENIGTSDLTLAGATPVYISGDDSEEFVITAQPEETIIPAGRNTTFTLTFNPLTIGDKSAVVVIENDDLDESPYTFTITGSTKPAPDFKARLRRGTIPLAVQFKEDSIGDIDSYVWDFGDGEISYEQEPTHTYTNPGSYTIVLTATGPGGTNYKVKSNYVTAVYAVRNDIDTYFGGHQVSVATGLKSSYVNDIAVVGSNSIAMWRNDGTGDFGRFQFETNWSTTSGSIHAVNLFGGSSYTEIIAGGHTTSLGVVYWYRTNASHWSEKQIVQNDIGVLSVYGADLNGNYTDILSVQSSIASTREIIWWENDGTSSGGYFPNPDTESPAGCKHTIDIATLSFTNAHSAIAVNLDGDSDNDILAAGDFTVWWENNGSGSFGSGEIVDTSTYPPSSIYVIDINKDDRMDIITASSDMNTVLWWENDGAGDLFRYTITRPPFTITQSNRRIIDSIFTEASLVSAGDLNNDGYNDVIAYGDNQIAWWKNKQESPYLDDTCKFVLEDNFQARSISINDMNNDDKKDIIATGDYGLSYWDLKIDGWWFQHTATDKLYNADLICASDLDNDGDNDMIASDDEYIVWWPNTDSDGTFSDMVEIDSTTGLTSLFAVNIDSNEDNDTDIIALEGEELIWWENDGDPSDGGWTKHTVQSGFEGANSIYAIDINNDGRMDILGTGTDTAGDPGVVYLWENNGSSWNRITLHYLEGTGDTDDVEYYSVYPIDIDGDSDLDIIASGKMDREDQGKVALWTNENGIFGSQQLIDELSSGVVTTDINAGDLNGDGLKDIIAILDGENVYWWEGKNDGTFEQNQRLFVHPRQFGCSLYATDIDEDGDLDLIGCYDLYTSPNDQLVLMRNNNTDSATFSADNFSTEIIGKSTTTVFTDDMDKDGDQDVLFAPIGPDGVVWCENNMITWGTNE